MVFGRIDPNKWSFTGGGWDASGTLFMNHEACCIDIYFIGCYKEFTLMMARRQVHKVQRFSFRFEVATLFRGGKYRSRRRLTECFRCSSGEVCLVFSDW